ncbi:hypothetical protein [Serratia quinivorans]|jgi:hypothetical protein|uniref:hypothetical protein n=1 Tax=Serratia quinivorans TaxID=137545 RepID=UPI0021BD4FD9|nr:hypothetical protein [Serratia quinivorans]
MPAEYLTFLPLIALGWTVVTFALGHFIGHRAAINRDKRKEYNALVSPVRIEIMKQIDSIKADDFYTTKFNKDQILMISDLLGKTKSMRLIDSYKTYYYATSYEGLKSKVGEYGLITIGETAPALAAATDLLKLLPMR